MSTKAELRIPEKIRLEAKKLTEAYHRQAQQHDDEAKKMTNQEIQYQKRQKEGYLPAKTLEDALSLSVESGSLGDIIELPEKDNGTAYAVVDFIVPFLFAGARCVVRGEDILDAYEAVTGKSSPIPRITLEDEGTTDTIEEV